MLVGFWLLGFLVGFAGYLLLSNLGWGILILESVYAMLKNQSLAEGILVGIATGFVTLGSVVAWAFTRSE